MPLTIKVNGTCLTLVHKMSMGISNATIPDVCKTPTPGGPVPIPYPNIAQSITLASGTTTVKGDKVMAANKGSKFSLSNGDNAGTIGGVKSNVFMKEATWLLYSFDVKMDNKNTCRLTDPMYHNSENTVNLAGLAQPDLIAALDGDAVLAEKLCEAACKAMKNKDRADREQIKKTGAAKSTSSYQRRMRKYLDPKPRGQTNPGIRTEVSQQIKRNGGEFVGKIGTAVGGDRVRWDIVVGTLNKGGKLIWDNVKYIIEVKFPGDSPTPNQVRAERILGKNKAKFKTLKVNEDCNC